MRESRYLDVFKVCICLPLVCCAQQKSAAAAPHKCGAEFSAAASQASTVLGLPRHWQPPSLSSLLSPVASATFAGWPADMHQHRWCIFPTRLFCWNSSSAIINSSWNCVMITWQPWYSPGSSLIHTCFIHSTFLSLPTQKGQRQV